MSVQDLGVPWGNSVGLGTHVYPIEVAKFQRQTLPILRESQNQGTEPGEQAISYENVWPRSAHDWRLGTNQPYFDEDDGVRNRFRSSIGVNPFNQRALTLQKDVNVIDSTIATGVTQLRTVYDGSLNVYLYWLVNGVLKFSTDPDGGMGSSISNTGIAIADFTDDGTNIYAAMASGHVRSAVIGATGTSMSTFGTFDADHIGVANGRLLATKAGRIVELDNAGAFGNPGQLDWTHPHAAFRWDFITSAPNGIYATGHIGFTDKTFTYFITVDQTTGGLTDPAVAVEWPAGEAVGCLAFYGGVMIGGISKVSGGGFRLANINGDGTLTYGPLAPVAQDAAAILGGQLGVTALAIEGEYCWFSWGLPKIGYKGVGRMWLARFTEPLVPAYATDLMYYDGASTSASVGAVARRLGKTYFAETVGLFGEDDDNYVPSGKLYTGAITYSTTEKKSPTAFDFRCLPLPAGASITTDLAVDGGTASTIDTYTTTDETGPSTPVAVEGFSAAEEMELTITLTRATDHTETPTLKRWTLRSMPTPPRVDEIILPIMLHDRVDMDNIDTPLDTSAEWIYLKNLEAAGTVVDLVIGNTTEKVRVDQISFASERVIGGVSLPVTWNRDRTFFQCPLSVRCLTVTPVSEWS